ncbi:MAG: 16S rRNA (guanine(966)-N(2))-methyltransferase RsmD [Candidatus Nitrotoga sp.]
MEKFNRLRIIGGTHRRCWVEFLDTADLRPTPNRVRETLFNWLGQDLNGKRCLDLFSGSGALGIEAVSRGAAEVLIVEKDSTVFRMLQASTAKLALPNVRLYCKDGLEFVREDHGLFDVIFLDPPFKSNYLPNLLSLLTGWLTSDGMIYVESGEVFEPGPSWIVTKRAKAGTVHYQLLQRNTTPAK